LPLARIAQTVPCGPVVAVAVLMRHRRIHVTLDDHAMLLEMAQAWITLAAEASANDNLAGDQFVAPRMKPSC
jgi:hypothetical protein